MAKSIYLINPADSYPTYYGAEVLTHLGLSQAAYMADLTMTTVAALIPDDFEITLCDEHIAPADFNTEAEVIAITGKTTQVPRMITLAQEFRKRGKIVLMGGPYVSLCPEQMRPHCDILCRGESEEIASQMFSDILNDCWKSEYIGNKPDLTTSPIPRWDLYPNDYALSGALQTARGCPFTCEFCDVIQYVGRKQRHKSNEQVIKELDLLYEYNYRVVFLADDNLTAYRHRSKELLKALAEWNNDRVERVLFTTQLSIDTAQDEQILDLLSESGPFDVFIGIETPNEESLLATNKKQNLRGDLVQQVHSFFEHGVGITGGMIVGFDADTIDIFERQYRFAMSTSIPIFTLGMLVAPSATPLFDRLKEEGRLYETNGAGAAVDPWTSNIVPKLMSREQLFTGTKWLANRLYHPEAFTERVLGFLDKLQIPEHWQKNSHVHSTKLKKAEIDASKVIYSLTRLGEQEAKMLSTIFQALKKKPEAKMLTTAILFRYAQIRYMYQKMGIWESDQKNLVSLLSA
ncbi:MAG: radical SAM protein [Microcoleaceae cyanobacterium]